MRVAIVASRPAPAVRARPSRPLASVQAAGKAQYVSPSSRTGSTELGCLEELSQVRRNSAWQDRLSQGACEPAAPGHLWMHAPADPVPIEPPPTLVGAGGAGRAPQPEPAERGGPQGGDKLPERIGRHHGDPRQHAPLQGTPPPSPPARLPSAAAAAVEALNPSVHPALPCHAACSLPLSRLASTTSVPWRTRPLAR